VDVIRELEDLGCQVSIHDPIADPREAALHHDVTLTPWEQLPVDADAIVAAVPHRSYLSRPLEDLLSRMKPNGVFIDVKSVFDRDAIVQAGYKLWRL
jgi:UDP-N-acetyl-D-galactosamine dehydrogenase